MLNQLDNYFFTIPEPEQSCLLFIRRFLLDFSPHLTEAWKFNTPFYYYKGKWFCYISYNKKKKNIYLGFVYGNQIDHPLLLGEGRKQIKVMYLDANKDIDIKNLKIILKKAMALY